MQDLPQGNAQDIAVNRGELLQGEGGGQTSQPRIQLPLFLEHPLHQLPGIARYLGRQGLPLRQALQGLEGVMAGHIPLIEGLEGGLPGPPPWAFHGRSSLRGRALPTVTCLSPTRRAISWETSPLEPATRTAQSSLYAHVCGILAIIDYPGGAIFLALSRLGRSPMLMVWTCGAVRA